MPKFRGLKRLTKIIQQRVYRLSSFAPVRNDSGQILLISLLVLVVAMTIGLSLAARTINNLRVTTAQDSSQRAFAAAEAGLERALTQISSATITGNLNNNSNYVTTVNTRSANEFQINSGDFLIKNDTADIWLSAYPDYSSPWTGTLNVYWGNSSDVCVGTPESSNTMSALEIVIISGTRASPTLSHYAFDPCNARRTSNRFSSSSSGGAVSGRNYAFRAAVNVTSGLLARIIPLYAGTYIGIRGTNLPPQGIEISSVGISGGTQRKLTSFRSYPKAPVEFYPYLIFSPK